MSRGTLLRGLLPILLASIGVGVLWHFASSGSVSTEGTRSAVKDSNKSASASLAVPAPPSPDNRAPLSSAGVSEAVSLPPDPARIEHLLRLIETLPIDPGNWPPRNNFVDFAHIDLSPLKWLVVENAFTFAELLEGIARLPRDSELRPALIAATAYCTALTAEDHAQILACARNAYLRPDFSVDWRLAPDAFAAFFSLRMAGERTQLSAGVGDLIACLVDSESKAVGVLPTLLAFGLDGPLDPSNEELLEAVRSALSMEAMALVTPALWGAFVRLDSKDGVSAAVDAASGGNGFAREGLERLRDPALTSQLLSLIHGRRGTVYGNYLCSSALTALYSMDDERSWKAFEELLRDPESRSWAPPWTVLSSRISTSNLGRLLALAAETDGSQAETVIHEQVLGNVARTVDAVIRAQVSGTDVIRAADQVRSLLPRIVASDLALSQALSFLAVAGGAANDEAIATWINRIVEPVSRDRIKSLQSRF